MNISRYWSNFKKENNQKLLRFLLALDILFILAHIASGYLRHKGIEFLYIENPDFSLVKDGSYPEVFQYIKALLASVFLFIIYWRSKSKMFGVWSLLFIYIFLDDSLMFHERFGKFLAGHTDLQPIAGLNTTVYGELLIYAVAGAFFMAFLVLAAKQRTKKLVNESRTIAFGVGILVIFGFGFDILHDIIASRSFIIGALFSILEDGGEMVVMSFLCWYTYNVWQYSNSKLPLET